MHLWFIQWKTLFDGHRALERRDTSSQHTRYTATNAVVDSFNTHWRFLYKKNFNIERHLAFDGGSFPINEINNKLDSKHLRRLNTKHFLFFQTKKLQQWVDLRTSFCLKTSTTNFRGLSNKWRILRNAERTWPRMNTTKPKKRPKNNSGTGSWLH